MTLMVTAKLRNLHIAPRKVRLVAELLKGKSAEEAGALLNFTVKRAAGPILKLLQSAIANAKNNFQLDPNNLYISKITVDEGPKMKRWMPRARGSASTIEKKTSHVYLVLDEIDKSLSAVRQKKRLTVSAKASAPAPLSGATADKTAGEEKSPKPGRQESKAEIKKPAAVRGAKKIFRRQVF